MENDNFGRSSYALLSQQLDTEREVWEDFFKKNINPTCTRLADQATRAEYPKYRPNGLMNNAMTRTWYHAYMIAYQEQITRHAGTIESMSLEDRAHIAFEARHHARLQTRSQMANKKLLASIEARDLRVYGNKDGPTFESLLIKNRDSGLSDVESYQAILDSALTTNEWVNVYISAVKSSETLYNYAGGAVKELFAFVGKAIMPDLSIDGGIDLDEVESDLPGLSGQYKF